MRGFSRLTLTYTLSVQNASKTSETFLSQRLPVTGVGFGLVYPVISINIVEQLGIRPPFISSARRNIYRCPAVQTRFLKSSQRMSLIPGPAFDTILSQLVVARCNVAIFISGGVARVNQEPRAEKILNRNETAFEHVTLKHSCSGRKEAFL